MANIVKTKQRDAKRLLRVVDTARLLGIDPNTLRKWVRTLPGFPQPTTLCGRPYFLVGEIEKWLEQQGQGGGSSRGA
jgi:predicted DNA-binding transcriptional regulator AlpA